MNVKIIGNTIMGISRNKVITVNPKDGSHHEMKEIARKELLAIGYKRTSEWVETEAGYPTATFQRVGATQECHS